MTSAWTTCPTRCRTPALCPRFLCAPSWPFPPTPYPLHPGHGLGGAVSVVLGPGTGAQRVRSAMEKPAHRTSAGTSGLGLVTGGARDRPGRTSGSPPASPGSAPRPQAKRNRAQTHTIPGPRLRPPRTVTPPFTGLRLALSGLHPFPSDLAPPVHRLRGGGGGRLGTTELAEPPNRPERPEVCGAERPRAAEAHFRRRPAGGSSSGPGEGESV